MTVQVGHAAANVGDADVVVYSSAVRPDNTEVAEATRRRIPVIARAEMLAELMRLRFGIAVAGAHGKTSTTSMVALVLERAGLDPTAVIGGRLSAFGSNARLGRGEYMVAEADESDRSFLKLSPSIAVITNIDREHMDAYGSFADLQQAFVDFANKVPFYGAVVACADDAELCAVLPRFERRVITYGINQPTGSQQTVPVIFGSDVTLAGYGSRCVVQKYERRGGTTIETLGELTLQVPGRHSVQNALAAVAVGLELDVPFARIASALGEFRGAERRFEQRGVDQRHYGGRRLRSSPDRNRRGAGGRARGEAVADRGRLPAAPLHAHARPDDRVRRGAGSPPTKSCSPASTRRARSRFQASPSKRLRP